MTAEHEKILQIARAELTEGAWRRVDLEQAAKRNGIDINYRTALEIIGVWKNNGIVDHIVEGKHHTYVWRNADPVPETGQTDPQMHADAYGSIQNEDRGSLWDAGLIARVLAVCILALVLLVPVVQSALNWRPSVVEIPKPTPIIITATPALEAAPARTIPSYHAPDGAYAGNVPLPDPGSVIARYGLWINVGTPHAARWVRSSDWLGFDVALVPDLQPTPTARVRVVHQEIPVPAPASAPAPAPASVMQIAPAQPTTTPALPAAAAEIPIAETHARSLDPGAMALACNETGCYCINAARNPTMPEGMVVVLSGLSPEACRSEAEN
jgi:hypothetical protein